MKSAAPRDLDFARRLGSVLRALRMESGLSQTQVAQGMGLSKSSQSLIGRYENGLKIPRVDQLNRYLQAVDSSLIAFAWLFDQVLTSDSAEIRGLVQELDQLTQHPSRSSSS